MVVNMMKWRPWPSILTKKFQVNLKVHTLEGLPCMACKFCELETPDAVVTKSGELSRVMVNVKWKGAKSGLRSRFRRSLKRARTTEKILEGGCTINWDEEFKHVCVLTMTKDNRFLPWNVQFVIVQVATKSKLAAIGTAILNLADFASPTENAKQMTKVHILPSTGPAHQSALVVTLDFVELAAYESLSLDRFMSPSLPCMSGPPLWEKNDRQLREEHSGKNVKDVKRSSTTYEKKHSRELEALYNGKLSPRSEQSAGEYGDLFDSDLIDESEEEEVIDGQDRRLQSYGPLAGVNLVVEGALHYGMQNRHWEDHELSICGRETSESILKADETSSSESDQGASQPTMRSILSWKKRKLSFRSPRTRGEPLLNKAYGEDGGDDIDYDRRLSGSPVEPLLALCQNSDASPTISGCLDFGEEHFSVGSWEKKDFVSRDGHMTLSANVFFASIDQRSERAAGESACTALVAVIADWLHQNPDRMPIKAEFDTLIREGSAEWRKLCDIETYRDRFPDGHFDLDTVLQAKVRPLVVAQERSFVGFFQPEGLGDACSFLQEAMSFENIWEAIWEDLGNVECDRAIYIVSWNDHFFVLKVERNAFYIIDTLGERLFEGCNQAYILRFDKETSLSVPKPDMMDGSSSSAETAVTSEKDSSGSSSTSTETGGCLASGPCLESASLPQKSSVAISSTNQKPEANQGGSDRQKVENIVYKGKDACKQFVKGFFAALPLRQLHIDIKKGLLEKVPLHQRLQIEFHYTSLGP